MASQKKPAGAPGTELACFLAVLADAFVQVGAHHWAPAFPPGLADAVDDLSDVLAAAAETVRRCSVAPPGFAAEPLEVVAEAMMRYQGLSAALAAALHSWPADLSPIAFRIVRDPPER